MSKRKLTAAELAAKIKELQQQQQQLIVAARAEIGEAVMSATGAQSLADFRRDFQIVRRPEAPDKEDNGKRATGGGA